jgi:ABC-2 type transport system ATP-binding protein
MEYAIEADRLVKSYPKGVTALDGLSFNVAPGSVFALLGPNGAGKSTAVKILTTLTKPDGGLARVGRLDVVENPDAVRRTIGVVAQGSGVDVQATGRENLRLQGQIHGIRGRAIEEHAQELLDRFGLADAADRIARGYSGGMQRRLDIAMALVHDPAVLFLDEPTTGLDPEVRADMWSEISRLSADRGKSVLLTTHYLEEADQLAGQIAIVDRGKVVAEGTPDELKRELRGDAIHVDLEREYNGEVRGAIGGLVGVRDVVVDGRTLRARADDGGRAVPAVLQALESAGVTVSSVRVARPSLDDVYLKYTGRTFDAADAEATTR